MIEVNRFRFARPKFKFSIMRKVLLLILCTCFSFIGCSSPEECQYEVAQFDLNAPYDEEIDFTDCGDNFLYYELDIEGELEGEIIINNIYKFKAQGKIDTLIQGDHYSNKFNFNYKPIGPVEGKLKKIEVSDYHYPLVISLLFSIFERFKVLRKWTFFLF